MTYNPYDACVVFDGTGPPSQVRDLSPAQPPRSVHSATLAVLTFDRTATTRASETEDLRLAATLRDLGWETLATHRTELTTAPPAPHQTRTSGEAVVSERWMLLCYHPQYTVDRDTDLRRAATPPDRSSTVSVRSAQKASASSEKMLSDRLVPLSDALRSDSVEAGEQAHEAFHSLVWELPRRAVVDEAEFWSRCPTASLSETFHQVRQGLQRLPFKPASLVTQAVAWLEDLAAANPSAAAEARLAARLLAADPDRVSEDLETATLLLHT